MVINLMKILLTEQSYFVVIPKVWDVRADQVVRSINGPYICGEGIDIWEDSVLTASWVAHDSLQVHFRLTAKFCFVWVISQEGKQTFFFSQLHHWFSQFNSQFNSQSYLPLLFILTLGLGSNCLCTYVLGPEGSLSIKHIKG